MRYLNQENKTLQMRNTSNPAYKAELNQMGQRGVPVLVVNGRAIAGSTSIIKLPQTKSECFKVGAFLAKHLNLHIQKVL